MCPNKADLNRADPVAGLEGKGRGGDGERGVMVGERRERERTGVP